MLLDLRRDVETAADVVNRPELLRDQLQKPPRGVSDTGVLETAANIEAVFTELEMKLVELRPRAAARTACAGARSSTRSSTTWGTAGQQRLPADRAAARGPQRSEGSAAADRRKPDRSRLARCREAQRHAAHEERAADRGEEQPVNRRTGEQSNR